MRPAPEPGSSSPGVVMQNVRRIDDPGAPTDLGNHIRRIHPAHRGEEAAASLSADDWYLVWATLLDARQWELANKLYEAVRENLPEPSPVSRRRV